MYKRDVYSVSHTQGGKVYSGPRWNQQMIAVAFQVVDGTLSTSAGQCSQVRVMAANENRKLCRVNFGLDILSWTDTVADVAEVILF